MVGAQEPPIQTKSGKFPVPIPVLIGGAIAILGFLFLLCTGVGFWFFSMFFSRSDQVAPAVAVDPPAPYQEALDFLETVEPIAPLPNAEDLKRAEDAKKAIEADELRREISEVQFEVERLQKKKELAELSKTERNKFTVLMSKFFYSKDGFLTKPILELKVKNNTNYAISRAYFHGVLITPGRSIPWVKADFNHSIPGGLEPGEEAVWRLDAGFSSDWSDAPRDRNDMILKSTLYQIDGPDGKALFDQHFTKEQQSRLDDLTRQLKRLKGQP